MLGKLNRLLWIVKNNSSRSILCVQKWQCVEDATGKLRLFKCKNEGGATSFQRGVIGRQRPISIKSQLYLPNSGACDCDFRDLRPLNLRPSMMKPFNKKPFFSKKSEC